MGSPITVDGIFGPQTQLAVRNIQSYFGPSVDGVFGPNTYFVYGQGVGANTTYGGPVYGSRTLSQGASGGDVTILQNRLNCFRYSTLIGHPADGNFDAATAQAVPAFKVDAANNGDTGFPANATVGNGTYDATWLYTFAGGRAIQTGRNGLDVVFLQTIFDAARVLQWARARIPRRGDARSRDLLPVCERDHGGRSCRADDVLQDRPAQPTGGTRSARDRVAGVEAGTRTPAFLRRLRDGAHAGFHTVRIALARPGTGPRGHGHRHWHQPAEPKYLRPRLRPLLVHDRGRTDAPDGPCGAGLCDVAGRAHRDGRGVALPAECGDPCAGRRPLRADWAGGAQRHRGGLHWTVEAKPIASVV